MVRASGSEYNPSQHIPNSSFHTERAMEAYEQVGKVSRVLYPDDVLLRAIYSCATTDSTPVATTRLLEAASDMALSIRSKVSTNLQTYIKVPDVHRINSELAQIFIDIKTAPSANLSQVIEKDYLRGWDFSSAYPAAVLCVRGRSLLHRARPESALPIENEKERKRIKLMNKASVLVIAAYGKDVATKYPYLL